MIKIAPKGEDKKIELYHCKVLEWKLNQEAGVGQVESETETEWCRSVRYEMWDNFLTR